MDTTASIKPQTLAELLPGLGGILSKGSMQALTAKKQPRQTMLQTRTAEKVVPLTAAEMRAHLMACEPHNALGSRSTNKKKTWNSSIKVDKTVSLTANGKLKNNPVRKVLNFQPKPKVTMNSRSTLAPELPKFVKPEARVKKSLFSHVNNNVRISGVSKISETPVINKPIRSRITETPIINKPAKSRMTLANKENMSTQNFRRVASPKITIYKKVMPSIPDTPMSNESGSDASFLLKEKEINDVEERVKIISNEQILENITEVTPPVSTPFREYRSVQDFFNNSDDIDNSATYHENTIMCFEKASESNEVKREESVIVSLCDLLNKASVNTKPESTELEDLVEIEKQTNHNIKMIESSITALNKIRESQLTSLQSVRKLIAEKTSNKDVKMQTEEMKMETEAKEISKVVKEETENPIDNIEKTFSVTSVIRSVTKSPTYKIPKKNFCLRKKVFCKSMPNVCNDAVTPVKGDMGNRALSMYMKMKEQMNFLSTPNSARSHVGIPNTPALTSHNLQEQLDKLYGEY